MTTSQEFSKPAQAIFLMPNAGERFSIIGGGVRILLDSKSSGGRCCVFDAPIPPGEGPPLHRHEREDELFFVVEGRVKFSVNGKEYIGEKGAFACAPRGSVHAFRNIGSVTARMLITCTPGGLEVPFRAVQIPEPGSGRPELTMDQIVAEFNKAGVEFVGPPLEA